MKTSRLIDAICVCILTIGYITSAQATLIGVLPVTPNGTDYQAYYDPVADLTWLANANVTGTMDWAAAKAWVASLDINGVTGWRLPDTIDVGNDGATYTDINQGVDYGYNITTPSELSNMFYNVLGNMGYFDTSGALTGCIPSNYCLTHTGPFSNLQPDYYWSATEYAPDNDYAWFFHMAYGNQAYTSKNGDQSAWAVHSGNVGGAVVPLPATVWLFGSGMIGLIGMARRKKVS